MAIHFTSGKTVTTQSIPSCNGNTPKPSWNLSNVLADVTCKRCIAAMARFVEDPKPAPTPKKAKAPKVPAPVANGDAFTVTTASGSWTATTRKAARRIARRESAKNGDATLIAPDGSTTVYSKGGQA